MIKKKKLPQDTGTIARSCSNVFIPFSLTQVSGGNDVKLAKTLPETLVFKARRSPVTDNRMEQEGGNREPERL